MQTRTLLLAFAWLVAPYQVLAQEAPPPPTEPAEAVAETEQPAEQSGGFVPEGSEVTIIQDGDKVIEEFRLNGRVYMVRITPKGLPPYYPIDRDGDGQMDQRVSELQSGFAPPNWVLMRW